MFFRMCTIKMYQTCNDLTLKKHQLSVSRWMVEHPDQKGMLVLFGVGTGKTLTAVNIANTLVTKDMVDVAFFLTPKSIVAGVKGDIIKCSGASKLPSHIKVFAHSAMKATQKAWTAARGKRKLLIVDEVHNLRSYNENKSSEQATTRIYKFISGLAKKSEKIIHLSATPMVNGPSDLALPMNMFLPKKLPIGSAFNKKFVSSGENRKSKMKNHREFNELTVDHMVFYNAPASSFPQVANPKFVHCSMSRSQQRALDDAEAKGRGRGRINAFLNKSRQISLSVGGKCSDKIDQIGEIIRRNRGPTVVYSFFVKSGVDVIQKCLVRKGVVDASRIMKVTGNISAKKRREGMEKFALGEIDVILISKSGSEGLNFPGVRNVIIASPDWNMAFIKQAIGRATRMTSKIKKIKLFYMVSDRDDDGSLSPDEHLYQFAHEKQELIDQFMQAMDDNAIQVDYDEIKKLTSEEKKIEKSDQSDLKKQATKSRSRSRSPKKGRKKSRRKKVDVDDDDLPLSALKKKRRKSASRMLDDDDLPLVLLRKKRKKYPKKPQSACAKKSKSECAASKTCSRVKKHYRRKPGSTRRARCTKRTKNCVKVKSQCRAKR